MWSDAKQTSDSLGEMDLRGAAEAGRGGGVHDKAETDDPQNRPLVPLQRFSLGKVQNRACSEMEKGE
jgi:hypothetical protein